MEETNLLDKNPYKFNNCMWSCMDERIGRWECQLRNLVSTDKREAVNICFDCKCFSNTLTEDEE